MFGVPWLAWSWYADEGSLRWSGLDCMVWVGLLITSTITTTFTATVTAATTTTTTATDATSMRGATRTTTISI